MNIDYILNDLIENGYINKYDLNFNDKEILESIGDIIYDRYEINIDHFEYQKADLLRLMKEYLREV